MARVTCVELLYKNEQPTISIRTTTSVDKLPMLIGECYGKMEAYLKETGVGLSDVPFVAYHNMDMQNLDVEMGFSVSKTLEGKDDIKAGVIPAGKVAFCINRGPYNECEPAYQDMGKWIGENGHTPSGVAYEFYYNSPDEFPESEMLTGIVMPLL